MTASSDDFPVLGDYSDPGPMGAAFVIAEDALGRVLCQLRDDFEHVSMPGHWCFFGGGVEPGETLAQTALREFHEETGITLPPDSLRPFVRLLSFNQKRSQLFVFRSSTIVAPDQVRVGEGAGFALWTRAQLAELRFAGWLAPARDKFLKEK